MINTRVREAVRGDASQMVLLLNDIIQVGGSTAHQTNFDEDKMINHYLARAGQISCQVAITNGRLSGFQSLMRPDHANDPMPDGWGIIASFVALEKSGLGIGQKLAIEAGLRELDLMSGGDDYKKTWATDMRELVDIEVANPGSLRAMGFQRLRAVRNLVLPN